MIEVRDRVVYTVAAFDVAAMRAMREKQLRELVEPGRWNAKLSPGGLVDCEYLVQALQIKHGHDRPELRKTRTLAAIRSLRSCGLLSAADHDTLTRCYIFLRRLIDALRMVRGDALDLAVPPKGSDEFQYLAHRLDYASGSDGLQRDLDHTMSAVIEVTRLLDALDGRNTD